MKIQNILLSVAILAIFVLATIALVVKLVISVIEVMQSILVATLVVAKIACKAVRVFQQALEAFGWVLSEIVSTVDSIHSSLEDWMVSTVPIPTIAPPSKSAFFLTAAITSSERTAFKEMAIGSLEQIAQQIKPQPAITNSLELAIAPIPLRLAPAANIPSGGTAFEYYAQAKIASSFKLAVPASDETIAQATVTTKPLGKVITIGKSTELIPLSVLGVYIQRTQPKKKKSKRELSKFTVPQLRDQIAKIAKTNNSLVVPKKSANKPVLVDWLLANQ